jgi:phosphate starvation-inducible protein PhoH and related proteins
MSKRSKKNPNGKAEHQERLAAKQPEPAIQESFSPLPNHPVQGISSPKLINRPKFRGNIPKMRPLVYRPNQQRFIDILQESQTKIVVLTGPAGTGKTLLAVRKGLEGILNGRFADMVLCRPLVEAGGEEMGYLPGSVDDKIGPYLEPFYDKLTAFLPEPVLKSLLNEKHIAATPLAFMRGRTFSESIVIIDEAQNTTVEQMKMAVTRLGPFSKMVICGDPDQSDIRGMSGLQYITALFQREGSKAEENGCYTCRLEVEDIQRNSVIAYLLGAFAEFKNSEPMIKMDEKPSNSHEVRLASLLEKTMAHIVKKEMGRSPRKCRSRGTRGPQLLQGDFFSSPQTVVLSN